MVEEGRVVRIDTDSSRYATLSGVRVGDTEGVASGNQRSLPCPEQDAGGGVNRTLSKNALKLTLR